MEANRSCKLFLPARIPPGIRGEQYSGVNEMFPLKTNQIKSNSSVSSWNFTERGLYCLLNTKEELTVQNDKTKREPT